MTLYPYYVYCHLSLRFVRFAFHSVMNSRTSWALIMGHTFSVMGLWFCFFLLWRVSREGSRTGIFRVALDAFLTKERIFHETKFRFDDEPIVYIGDSFLPFFPRGGRMRSFQTTGIARDTFTARLWVRREPEVRLQAWRHAKEVLLLGKEEVENVFSDGGHVDDPGFEEVNAKWVRLCIYIWPPGRRCSTRESLGTTFRGNEAEERKETMGKPWNETPKRDKNALKLKRKFHQIHIDKRPALFTKFISFRINLIS